MATPWGFHQQKIEANLPAQLIRVTVPFESRLMAEVSGGRHSFSVRFMRFDEQVKQRPEQVYEDIPFDFAICVM